jgi:hypothetical protein
MGDVVSDQIVHIEKGDPDESRDLELALACTQALEKAYPNHFWIVSFAGHNLIVRHVAIANAITLTTGKEGFGSLLPRNKIGTVHEACASAVKFGGALLEAFKLPRVADGETYPTIPADLMAAIKKGQQLKGMGKG